MMQFVALLLLFSTVPTGVDTSTTTAGRIATALTKELGGYADANSMGIWFALHSNTNDGMGNFNLSLGTSDGAGGTIATDADILPVGSFCKPWTAVAIMRMAEQGKFQLDDAFSPLVDTYMQKWNNTSTTTFWGPEIQNVTVKSTQHAACST